MMRHVGNHRKRQANRTVTMMRNILAGRNFHAAAERRIRLRATIRHLVFNSAFALAAIRLDFHSGQTI